MRWYLDTSAALKLLLDEAESTALVELVAQQAPELVSSVLLETELRLAARRSGVLRQAAVTSFLEGLPLYELPRSLFVEAGVLCAEELRLVDAMHVVAALRCGAACLVTYDQRLATAARSLGLSVLTPVARA
ncbi:Probable ribonuclease VapC46 [Actinomyces bovis]|uniref:Ribonuclease VapC n=1 Tax=Actinomyces bovis TaxID=1658 RepID=A0ABY1VPX6_9ACTO|nr:type II toxin-antitoxin system VapC family toxin [Actinomyces bovis]SPT53979.1 Probable ribonuclease VapC46 [Actinomyces bovis]VEG53528.1 Probable ribonuclease VapC46 [Actinomyces israelii]